jgi:hypothetical protein
VAHVITGVHTIIVASQPEEVRAFCATSSVSATVIAQICDTPTPG